MALAQSQEQALKTELTIAQQRSMETTMVADPRSLQDYVNLAKVLAASGMFPDAKTGQQAVGLMILGRHFGLSPVQSLTAIHVVKGKPMLHYSAILAKVRQHPDYDYEILEDSEKLAKIQFFYRNKPCGIAQFDIEKAKKRQTQNIDKMADVMLIARATGDGVRRFCPDVLNGMVIYAQGEMAEDVGYADVGGSKKDLLKAELEAKAAERENAIVAEAVDVASEEPFVPDDYDGPKISDEQPELVS